MALTPAQKVAVEAVQRIDAMYHLDNSYKGSPAEEILNNRQLSVKPLVDAYFAWIKQQRKNNSSTNLKEAVTYSINQETYLRAFLNDPELPLDNNDAERSIKAFCVGKHSWHIIDSTRGARASALLYSIAETAKANNLKPYQYFAYLLTELMKYPWDNVTDNVLEKIMHGHWICLIAVEKLKQGNVSYVPAFELALFVKLTGYLPFTFLRG